MIPTTWPELERLADALTLANAFWCLVGTTTDRHSGDVLQVAMAREESSAYRVRCLNTRTMTWFILPDKFPDIDAARERCGAIIRLGLLENSSRAPEPRSYQADLDDWADSIRMRGVG